MLNDDGLGLEVNMPIKIAESFGLPHSTGYWYVEHGQSASTKIIRCQVATIIRVSLTVGIIFNAVQVT